MNFLDKLKEFKVVITIVVVSVSTVLSIVAWADNELEQQQIMIEAKSALAHNEIYQESRIARKADQVTENKRELDNLLEYIGGKTPTVRQEREIDYLDKEISRLRLEMENIRVELETK